MLEGGPDQPVISIAALAAVKDADVQANANRYIAEVIAYFDSFSQGNPWSGAREAVWYWSRIFIIASPKKILWWRSPRDMDRPSQRWDAPSTFEYPSSDPAPKVPPSAPAKWLDAPANRSPKGRHTLDEYGLDEAAIERVFGEYMTHYGIVRESA